jgi:ribosomal protein S21
VFSLPIIIKARHEDHPGDLIKKFKKVIAATNIIQVVKDRKYYMKPSEVRTVRQNELRRMHKRLRSLKKMKNIPAPRVIVRKTRPDRRPVSE